MARRRTAASPRPDGRRLRRRRRRRRRPGSGSPSSSGPVRALSASADGAWLAFLDGCRDVNAPVPPAAARRTATCAWWRAAGGEARRVAGAVTDAAPRGRLEPGGPGPRGARRVRVTPRPPARSCGGTRRAGAPSSRRGSRSTGSGAHGELGCDRRRPPLGAPPRRGGAPRPAGRRRRGELRPRARRPGPLRRGRPGRAPRRAPEPRGGRPAPRPGAAISRRRGRSSAARSASTASRARRRTSPARCRAGRAPS